MLCTPLKYCPLSVLTMHVKTYTKLLGVNIIDFTLHLFCDAWLPVILSDQPLLTISAGVFEWSLYFNLHNIQSTEWCWKGRIADILELYSDGQLVYLLSIHPWLGSIWSSCLCLPCSNNEIREISAIILQWNFLFSFKLRMDFCHGFICKLHYVIS